MNTMAVALLLEDIAVSSGKPFIPDKLTPLFYTPSYQELTAEQRLRYNQLHALYFNEQIMFFEAVLDPLLAALQREPWPDRIAEGLQSFREEERQHTEMFMRLNRSCAPQLYGDRNACFIEIPAAWRAALRWVVDHPLSFPLFLWLMLLQEERSLFYSRCYLRDAAIEPSFAAAHRLHLADEARHVRWDEELLDALWQRTRPFLRTVNAKLFAWMLEEFFAAPKRGQLRVIEQLVRELPELRGRLPEMRRQVLALSRDEAYRKSLYSREVVPRTFARFDRTPEFRRLRLCGYLPRPEVIS